MHGATGTAPGKVFQQHLQFLTQQSDEPALDVVVRHVNHENESWRIGWLLVLGRPTDIFQWLRRLHLHYLVVRQGTPICCQGGHLASKWVGHSVNTRQYCFMGWAFSSRCSPRNVVRLSRTKPPTSTSWSTLTCWEAFWWFHCKKTVLKQAQYWEESLPTNLCLVTNQHLLSMIQRKLFSSPDFNLTGKHTVLVFEYQKYVIMPSIFCSLTHYTYYSNLNSWQNHCVLQHYKNAKQPDFLLQF